MFFFDCSSDEEEKSLILPQIPDSLINRSVSEIFEAQLPVPIPEPSQSLSTINEPQAAESVVDTVKLEKPENFTSFGKSEGSGNSENPELAKNTDKAMSKLEIKRMKSKIRSKKSRDRKKLYLEQLENRIKELEKENYRLNKLLKVLFILILSIRTTRGTKCWPRTTLRTWNPWMKWTENGRRT